MNKIDDLIDIYKRLRSCSSVEEVETLKGNLKDAIGAKDISTRKRKIEEVIGSSEEGGGEGFEISGENRKLGKSRTPLVVELTKQVDDLIGEVKELATQGEFPHGVTLEVPEPMTVELPANGVVGKKFLGYLQEILHFLQTSERAIIGVWGMGGVGKTSLVKHAHNLMLSRPDIFGSVYWVTVSKGRSIKQLQAAIAKRVGEDLSSELDEHVRAGKLSRALERAEKFVLFLDDMWTDFELSKVGIPTKSGCNLVLTSRSNHVCRKMDCQKRIKLKPLSKKDPWTLFLKRIGHEIPHDITKIAKDVVKECAGLPLGIITLATSLRECNDIREWSDVLRKLRNSTDRVEDMEEKVFKVLRLSYERLNSLQERKCLLYCATYPEDYIIPRNDLIWGFIDEGYLDGNDSIRAMFDEGHTILNKLEGAALLSKQKDGVSMHDLIRDMALQIAGSDFMVKARIGLEAFPDVNKWKDKVVLVSLMFNDIREMLDLSPKCRRLSTLLLQYMKIKQIRDGFFKYLCRLKVLNLSYSQINTLPESITSLENITSLILRRCIHLKSLPSLEKLTSLERLDLFDTGIAQVPSGLHHLINLRYLNLYRTNIKMIGAGVVRRMTALQYLGISFDMDVQEILLLNRLEHLLIHFYDVRKFLTFVQHVETSRSRLTAYFLTLGDEGIYMNDEINYFADKYVWFRGKIIKGGARTCKSKLPIIKGGARTCKSKFPIIKSGASTCNSKFPKLPCDVQRLRITVEDVISLCELFSSPLHNLEHLTLESLFNLRSLFGNGRGAELSFYSASFSNLKSLIIYNCHKLKKLFPEEVLTNLRNVEDIWVLHCDSLEEMVGAEIGECVQREESKLLAEFSLPSLKFLELMNLPKLRSLCRRNQVIHFASLQAVTIWECPVLKRMPFDLHSQHPPFPRFRFWHEEETWFQYLEWDPPKSKSLMTFEKLRDDDLLSLDRIRLFI